MMYKVSVTPIVGLPQFAGWSQVFSNYNTKGQLVCAFGVAGNHAGNVGRDLTTMIDQAKIASAADLHQLIKKLDLTVQEMDATMMLACGYFTAKKVFLAVKGGSIFLKRGQKSGILLNSDHEIKLIEGYRKSSDVVALITLQARSFIGEIEQKFLAGFEIDSVVTSIIPGLHGLENSSLSSIAFVSGGKEFDQENKVVETADSVNEQLAGAANLELGELGKSRINVSQFNFNFFFAKIIQILHAKITSIFTVTWQLINKINLRQRLNLGQLLSNKKLPSEHKLSNTKQSPSAKQSPNASQLQGIKQPFIKILQFFTKIIGRLSGNVYLNTNSSRKSLKKWLPMIIIGLVLIGLVGFKIYQNKQQQIKAQAALTPYLEQLTSAKQLVNTDPITARQNVNDIIAQLKQIEAGLTGQEKAQQLVTTQIQLAQIFYEDISGQESLGQLEIFYDLRLVDQEFVSSAVAIENNLAVFLDQEKKQIIILNLEKSQAKEISLALLEKIVDMKLIDNQLIILGNGVYKLNLATDNNDEPKPIEIIAQGDSNRNATLLEAFASYVYVFNPEKRNIYRYVQQQDTFSEPIGWVSGAAGFDYNQVATWAIDGDIWVGTRKGELFKLSSGSQQKFEVTGLEKPFAHSLLITTTAELENLYILEPDNRRLVVLNKKGELLKEIASESFATATSIFVSEKLGKAYAVSGSIIYALGL